MKPKHDAPKLVAIICVVALLVAIYCSCFVAPKEDTVGGIPVMHSPYSDTLTALPEPSTKSVTSTVFPAPPADTTVVIETISTDDDYVWLGDSRIRLYQEDDMEPSAKSLLSLADCHYWDDEEVMDYFEKVEPSLQYTCPYDIHKCVSNMTYTSSEVTITCDVYLFSVDGIIGTWFVSDSGKEVVFFGEAFIYATDSGRAILGRFYKLNDGSLAVLRDTAVLLDFSKNVFMVDTYHEEIAKIS